MPLYVFQTSGNPFVRILIGLVSFAVLVGLGFLMLPVVLAVIAAVMVMLSLIHISEPTRPY